MNGSAVAITYLGQSTFRFTTPEAKIVLIDPWTAGNPLCPREEKQVRAADLVLVTHGLHRPQLAMVPIGDHHTMMATEAAVATGLLGVDRVVPMHFGVSPGSADAPAAFRRALDDGGLGHVRTIELVPGQTITAGALV